MKKIILLSVFVGIFIIGPQTTYAAWWNPFSWFNNWTSSKPIVRPDKNVETQMLENRIKELEKKLEAVTATTTATTVEKVAIPTTPVPVSAKPKIVPTTPPIATTPKITQTPQPVVDNQKAYLDLVGKYLAFSEMVNSKYESLRHPNASPVEQMYREWLYNFRETIEKSADEYRKISNTNPKPPDVISYYNKEFNNLSKIYQDEQKRVEKFLLIEYFAEHKERLYQPDEHISAAGRLDSYDRVYGTKFAPAFRQTKTYQETVEFAESLLLDLKQ